VPAAAWQVLAAWRRALDRAAAPLPPTGALQVLALVHSTWRARFDGSTAAADGGGNGGHGPPAAAAATLMPSQEEVLAEAAAAARLCASALTAQASPGTEEQQGGSASGGACSARAAQADACARMALHLGDTALRCGAYAAAASLHEAAAALLPAAGASAPAAHAPAHNAARLEALRCAAGTLLLANGGGAPGGANGRDAALLERARGILQALEAGRAERLSNKAECDEAEAVPGAESELLDLKISIGLALQAGSTPQLRRLLKALADHPAAAACDALAVARDCLAPRPWRSEPVAMLALGFALRLAAERPGAGRGPGRAGSGEAAGAAAVKLLQLATSTSVRARVLERVADVLQSEGGSDRDSAGGAAEGKAVARPLLSWMAARCWNWAVEARRAGDTAGATQLLACWQQLAPFVLGGGGGGGACCSSGEGPGASRREESPASKRCRGSQGAPLPAHSSAEVGSEGGAPAAGPEGLRSGDSCPAEETGTEAGEEREDRGEEEVEEEAELLDADTVPPCQLTPAEEEQVAASLEPSDASGSQGGGGGAAATSAKPGGAESGRIAGGGPLPAAPPAAAGTPPAGAPGEGAAEAGCQAPKGCNTAAAGVPLMCVPSTPLEAGTPPGATVVVPTPPPAMGTAGTPAPAAAAQSPQQADAAAGAGTPAATAAPAGSAEPPSTKTEEPQPAPTAPPAELEPAAEEGRQAKRARPAGPASLAASRAPGAPRAGLSHLHLMEL
jgi:hypothetical protein